MRVVQIGCFVLLAVIAADRAGGAEIRFRAETRAAGNLVRLGDVAEIVANDARLAGELSSVELFPAPAPGQQVVITAREICDRLNLRGMSLAAHTISGASRLSIAGAVQPSAKPTKPQLAPSDNLREQAELRIRAAIIEYLQNFTDATPAWQVDFELSDEQVRLVCQTSAKPAVQGGQEPWTGKQQFEIGLGGAGSRHQMSVTATIEPAAPVVVANRAIGRGVVLSRADVRLQMPTTLEQAEGALRNLEDVVGRETVRSLSADDPIRGDALQAPLLVRNRDIVTVYVRSPGIRVRVTGRAVQDGALGDLITVESLSERKAFFARVSGAQEVEVFASAQQAAAGERAMARN
jgi:flagella basal body P-ring formation protein FlgA